MLHCCSQSEAQRADPPSSPSRARRGLVGLVQWAIPVTVLALVPKCPACVAAYVLLFTGFGLSLPAAAAMRWTLISLSAAAITLLVIRAIRKLAAGQSAGTRDA